MTAGRRSKRQQCRATTGSDVVSMKLNSIRRRRALNKYFAKLMSGRSMRGERARPEVIGVSITAPPRLP